MAKRWIHAGGKKDFNSVGKITKNTLICQLYFDEPMSDNPDTMIGTSYIKRITSNCKGRK